MKDMRRPGWGSCPGCGRIVPIKDMRSGWHVPSTHTRQGGKG